MEAEKLARWIKEDLLPSETLTDAHGRPLDEDVAELMEKAEE